MKRWWPVLLLVLMSVSPAMAQKYGGDITMSLQPGVGVAVGSFSNDYDIAADFTGTVDFTLVDGTAIGLRTGYRMFNTTDLSKRPFVKIAQFGVHGKRYFTPDTRVGLYGLLGGGIFWLKEVTGTRSNPDFGGYGGLGLHFQSSDRLSLFVEGVYNNFLTEPTSTGYFTFSAGITIGLREE